MILFGLRKFAAMAGGSVADVGSWLSLPSKVSRGGWTEQGVGREEVPAHIRARILPATRSAAPEGHRTGLSREMVHLKATLEHRRAQHAGIFGVESWQWSWFAGWAVLYR